MVLASVSGEELVLELGNSLKVRVCGDEREVAGQGCCGNEGVDVADEAGAAGWTKAATDVSVAVKNRIGEEVGVDRAKDRPELLVSPIVIGQSLEVLGYLRINQDAGCRFPSLKKRR